MIPFTKMHGLGNDYVVIDERDRSRIDPDRRAEFARLVCDRGFSVGADGVLFLLPDEESDLTMRIVNADGSEAESCGNGLRCAAYYQHGLQRPGTGECTINLPLDGRVQARVEYREPPTAQVRLTLSEGGLYEGKRTVELSDRTLTYHRVDVGNPHAVFLLEENDSLPDSPDDLPLDELGEEIQVHPDFADSGGINAEFVRPDSTDPDAVHMRVHERGVGETTSCGTGCVAIARAWVELGRGAGWITVNQPGGALRIETDQGYLEGEAEYSYQGFLNQTKF